MEEIIEFLETYRESVSTPLELPNHDDLVVIEEEILMPIPFDYREFLLSVSDVIYGNIEPATAADPRSHTYLSEMTAQAWDLGLPRDVLPICEYDGGYSCIDQNGKVSFWRFDEFSETTWESIWHWARDVWLDGKVS